MANGFTFNIRDKRARILVKALQDALQERKIRPMLNAQAQETRKELIAKTPRGFSGYTKRQWRVQRITKGYAVTNDSKVMKFLEKGTKAHGPKRARRLFIPQSSRAFFNGYQPGMEYGRGKDFVLAKWVRGIKAMNIVAKERVKTNRRVKAAMIVYVRAEISEALAKAGS